MTELPATWTDAASDVLSVLRPHSAPAAAWSLRDDPVRGLARRPFAPHLHELLVLDHRELRRFLSWQVLRNWGVRLEEALATAYGNLEPGLGLTLEEDEIWAMRTGDGYESSRLLLPGWLASFQGRVAGAPVAAVPHARLVLVTGAARPEALEAILDQAERAWPEAADPISPALYGLDDGGAVVPWQPEADHPLAKRVARAQANLADHARERLAEVGPTG